VFSEIVTQRLAAAVKRSSGVVETTPASRRRAVSREVVPSTG